MTRELTGRSRLLVILVVVVLAGLASRRSAGVPEVVETHAGDVLWATAVVVALALVWPVAAPRSHPRPVTFGVIGFSIAACVELSQAWNPGWLDDLRANDTVALVLGRGFLWADFPRYAVGCALGTGLVALARLSTAEERPA